MDSEDFVKLIKVQAVDGAIEASVLQSPPGRGPMQRDLGLSRWFRSASPDDQERMLALVKESVTQAVFSFLAVLDGVAALPEENDTATLQLFHVNADDRTLLNGNEEELHNIFNRIATTTIVKPQAKLRAYETGSARALLRKSVPGDGLEIHHVPNKSFGTKGIHGYDPGTAPAIALPKQDHRRIR